MKQRLGEFDYNDLQFEKTLGSRVDKPVVLLENGAKYHGEWLVDSEVR
jgi:hypothetical protein